MNTKVIENSKIFFELKNKFYKILEQIEEDISEQNKDLLGLEKVWTEMSIIVNKTDSEYFKIKIAHLRNLLNDFILKKQYDKIEFNKIFFQLSRIKTNDSIEFLDSAIKNRIEKIAKKQMRLKKNYASKNFEQFLTFRYNTVYFIIKNYPKKILENIDKKIEKIKINGKEYKIFPTGNFGESFSQRVVLNDNSRLFIFNKKEEYACYRFDSIGEILQFNRDTFLGMLKKVEIQNSQISQFLRKAGINYYYIPF